MTATLHALLKSYREGGVFPSYDQLAALIEPDRGGAAVRGEAVAELPARRFVHVSGFLDADYVDFRAGEIFGGGVLNGVEYESRHYTRTGAEEFVAEGDWREVEVSARAADAPSEPSEAGEASMLRQALTDLHHAIQFAHDSLGGGIHKMPTMLHQSGTVTEFIENVLSAAHNLDFQPANTAWKLVPSKPTEAMLRSAISYREVAANDEIQDPVLSILDRQYRAMLAAADALDSQPTERIAELEAQLAECVALSQKWASAAGEADGRAEKLRVALEYYADPKTNAPGSVAREALAASSQPTDGCPECRHTYCMSGEVCKACGDVAMQGWKGGRQPTDGGVRNG